MSILIDNFPNDEDEWYVLHYGDILTNSTKNTTSPNLIITLRNKKTGKQINSLVPVGAVQYIRIGTIWKKQKFINEYYYKRSAKSFKKKLFSFSLHQNQPQTVIFTKNSNGTKEVIPVTFSTDLSQYPNRIGGAYVRLVTDEKVTVYISAMELFSSTYVPFFPVLREDLLTLPLDKVLEKYVRACTKNKTELFLHPKQSHRVEVIAMLSYLYCNKVSRSRASQLNASLRQNFGRETNLGKTSCLLALPYHPTVFKFEGSGFWRDSNTAYIQRIDIPYIPDDYKINYTHITREDEKEEEIEKENSIPNNRDKTTKTLILQNQFAPSVLQKIIDVHCDIAPSTGNAAINRIEEEARKRNGNYNPKDEIDDPVYAGVGKTGSTKESKKTASVNSKEEKQIELNKDSLMSKIISFLDSLVEEKKIKYSFIDAKGISQNKPVLFSFYAAGTGREGMYLIRVDNMKGKIYHLLETDRRYKSASYIGISFGEVIVDQELRDKIIEFMARNKHHVSKIKKEDKNDFPIQGYETVRNYNDETRLHRTLSKHLHIE